MADVKKIVELEIDTNTGEIKLLNKELDKTQKTVDDVGKSTKKSTGAISGMARGFKAVGTAIKAAGIGLLVAALAKIGEVMGKNQSVLDGFSNAMTTISIVIGEVGDALKRVYDNVSQSSENFDALGKVLSGIISIVLAPLKLAWVGIQAAISGAQLAWEKSWFGDNDPQRIKELEAELSELGQEVIKIGEEVGKGAMDIYNNFSEAIDEAGAISKQVMEEVKKVSIEAAYEQATALTEIRKAAELAEVQQQGLIEKYDRQAEIQRQIRDDFNLSFKERIAANEELSRILDEQAAAETKLIQIRQNALEQEFAARQLSQQEYLVQKQLLENEEKEIEARITGFKSEQLINRQQLEKENADEMHSIFEELVKMNEEEEEKKREQAKKTAEAKQAYEQATFNAGVNLIGELANMADASAKRGFAIQKAAGIAQAVINTAQAITKVFAETTDFTPTQTLRFVNAGIVAASGALQIATIARQKFDTSSAGSASKPSLSSGGGVGGQAPQFNTVGASGTNQLAESIAGQNDKPSRAYVVATDVTTAQELERNRVGNASFG